MNNIFNFCKLLWNLLRKIILERLVINFFLKNKAGRWVLLSFLLPTLILYVLGYVSEPQENQIQEALDGLTILCMAQENHYSENGRMYNEPNVSKGEGKYYYFGLIKYNQNDRIAPIYAEPKEPTLSTFVGLAVMSSQDKFSCLICQASVDHNVDSSKNFPIVNGNSVDCPEGYYQYK
ncbi:MAG: hypothetical protein WBA93_03485 [Microcoleaceae cyanobacterium]